MAVDIKCIEENALRLIKDGVTYSIENDSNESAMQACYYATGVMDMYEVLKEVLKDECE